MSFEVILPDMEQTLPYSSQLYEGLRVHKYDAHTACLIIKETFIIVTTQPIYFTAYLSISVKNGIY